MGNGAPARGRRGKQKTAPPKARRASSRKSGQTYYEMSDYDLEDAADSGVISVEYMGQTADQVRNMMHKKGVFE